MTKSSIHEFVLILFCSSHEAFLSQHVLMTKVFMYSTTHYVKKFTLIPCAKLLGAHHNLHDDPKS